jgi:hypothetical protein
VSDKKCAGCGSAIFSNYITIFSEEEVYYDLNCFEIEKYKTMKNIESTILSQNKAMLHIVKAIPTLNENTKLLSELLGRLDKLITALTVINTPAPAQTSAPVKPKLGRPKKSPVTEKN